VQFCAVTVYSSATLRPDPAGGANSVPPDILAGFFGEERRRRKVEGKGREKKRRGGRKGKEKKLKGKWRGGKEKGINGMEREERG